MAWGSVSVRVRPLRIGYLVHPNDTQGVFRAIKLNSFLWGGSYNPIIPAFSRTPPRWEAHPVRRLPKAEDIITGYLEGFDPDIVVPIGKCAGRSFNVGNRELVEEAELLGDITKSSVSNYGIGFIDLISDFQKKEFKYKRNDDLHLAIPHFPRAYRMFLASIFGVVSKETEQYLASDYFNDLRVDRVKPSLRNFYDLLSQDRYFPRHITSWALDVKPLNGATIFVCDAKSGLDIIDYWNLRAAGKYVLPIPIQESENENIKQLVKKFIEDNYRPYRDNPKMYHSTTIQRSRTLSKDVAEEFAKSLKIEAVKEKSQFKYSLRWWYPRLWDTWARSNTSEGISFPYSHDDEIKISEGETRLELSTVNPKIKLSQYFSDKPKFVNEFGFRFYSSVEPMAELIPEGSRELSSAIGRTGYHNWRFSRRGPAFLADNEDDLIFLDLPLAESVMTEWFKERGWKVVLSGPGRIAKQLMKQLGGTYGTSLLAHKGIISLLADLEKEAGVPRQAVIGKLNKVIKDDELYFDSDRFLNRLIKANAIRLGAKVQCPICTRYNWYELNTLEYNLNCRFCLSDYQPPLGSPKDIEWAYRAYGPFASSIAQGSFTVLLTLKFLSGDHHGRSVTPLFSYTAKNNKKLLEADLTCLCKRSVRNESQVYTVHAECKSFNLFEKRDVDRMRDLSSAFPGSVLIFSKLSESLTKSEVEMITGVVMLEREKRMQGGTHSPVIILTGIELFSSRGHRDCWKGRGGSMKNFISVISIIVICLI